MTCLKPIQHAVVILALTAASLPALAQSKPPSEKLDAITPQALLKDIIREDDVTLLFKHLRESMAAAARGQEAQEPEALKRRAEQIERDLAARGTLLMGALLSVVEAEAKRALREIQREAQRDPPRESAPRSPAGI